MTISLFSRFTPAHLDKLEAEAIRILREIAIQRANPVLLFSAGKSSLCLLRLAEKAFGPDRFPFPLLHIDSGHNDLEVLAFRDWRVAELGARLIVHSVEESIRRGSDALKLRDEARHQSAALRDAIEKHAFDICISGARRDESGHGNPWNQQLGQQDTNPVCIGQDEDITIFPLSTWTELEIWRYIEREQLELPSIYYAHRRPVVRKNGQLQLVTALTPAPEGGLVETLRVRFPTIGDIHGSVPVESDADSATGIIAELTANANAEYDDAGCDGQFSDKAILRRKKVGNSR